MPTIQIIVYIHCCCDLYDSDEISSFVYFLPYNIKHIVICLSIYHDKFTITCYETRKVHVQTIQVKVIYLVTDNFIYIYIAVLLFIFR